MNWRNKHKVVAKETLVSKDRTYVVGGNMLGEQYVALEMRDSLDRIKNFKQ